MKELQTWMKAPALPTIIRLEVLISYKRASLLHIDEWNTPMLPENIRLG